MGTATTCGDQVRVVPRRPWAAQTKRPQQAPMRLGGLCAEEGRLREVEGDQRGRPSTGQIVSSRVLGVMIDDV